MEVSPKNTRASLSHIIYFHAFPFPNSLQSRHFITEQYYDVVVVVAAVHRPFSPFASISLSPSSLLLSPLFPSLRAAAVTAFSRSAIGTVSWNKVRKKLNCGFSALHL